MASIGSGLALTHLLTGRCGIARPDPDVPRELFPGVTNPFPWMAEMIDLKKEKNFFETRVTEYQTGGALSWD